MTTIVTASVVGVGVTSTASQRRRMPRIAAFFAVVLGGIAPLLVLVPFGLAVLVPWYVSGGIIQLLGLGLLLLWAACQALAMWLRPRTAIRSGLIVTGVIIGIALLEAFLVFNALSAMTNGWEVLLTGYPALAVVIAMLVSARWARGDAPSGESFVERLAGVTEPSDEEPTADD